MRTLAYRLAVAALGLTVLLAPTLADARAGKGTNAGTRVERSAPATAPQGGAFNQTQPGQQMNNPGMAQPQRPGFFQRNPMMGALLGGLAGAGLMAMLFGGDFLGAGFAGFLGLLLQMALIGGLVWLVVGFLRRRAAPKPAYAQGHETVPIETAPQASYRMGGLSGSAAAAPRERVEIPIGPADLTMVENLLIDIQAAWSQGDMIALRRLMTPEMVTHMERQLAEDRRRGVRNQVEQVALLKGDLEEAWEENGTQYLSATMRWSALDYEVKEGSGELVSGNRQTPVEAAESWSLVRSRDDNRWILAAIRQLD